MGETIGTTTTFGSIVQSALGSGTHQRLDSSGRNRWGDYSATVIDPNNEHSFWTFQEYVVGTNNWAVNATEINISAVPEPTSLSLLAAAILLPCFARR